MLIWRLKLTTYSVSIPFMLSSLVILKHDGGFSIVLHSTFLVVPNGISSNEKTLSKAADDDWISKIFLHAFAQFGISCS